MSCCSSVRRSQWPQRQPGRSTMRSTHSLALTLGLFVTTALSPVANAQETTGVPGAPDATTTIDGRRIPPPPAAFGGTINLDAPNSTPYWQPHGRAAEGRSQHPPDHNRRCGLCCPKHLRRSHSHSDARSHRQHGAALHAVSHHLAVFAHACGPYHRAQSPLGGLRRDQRSLDRLSRLRQRHNQGQGDHRPDPQGEWLCHVVVRQEPQHAVFCDKSGRSIRSMARGHGL